MIEVWGGVECTVNRVGDRFHHQLDRSGHATRLDDLDRIAALGIRALRYPVLWERTAPHVSGEADWSWSDERLGRLRALGVTPIVGLVHHGSGPEHTSLVSPCFAEKLAAYAGAVAARYPWVEYWTPVNEPLTTARFSALYGVWYPHARSPHVFVRAVLNQCRGTALAMEAIRQVNPSAKLVQTDDLGKYYATPALADQCAFNNELRWLAWDLLAGRVTPEHALYDWVVGTELTDAGELAWFVEHPSPPDILGVNHYVTSERFIDERIDRYPESTHGGNGRERYADVEAVRCAGVHTDGAAALLVEAWERYRLPIAVTEVQLAGPREEQLRWFVHMWRAAREARKRGADVRAVTTWALFGSFDWNSLVTREAGYYEAGAFDVRSGAPRATAMAKLIQRAGRGSIPRLPALAHPGWWDREERVLFDASVGPSTDASPITKKRRTHRPRRERPILIAGATGTLGRAFARICASRGLAYRMLDRAAMDVASPESVARALDDVKPWAVVNATGYVRVDEAERDMERCLRENALGPETLAAACARRRIPLATFSSDLVFDGERESPYMEHDAPSPLNVYGRTKAEGERRVLERHPGALVVRTSAFFGPWDAWNFVKLALEALRDGREVRAANDLIVSPTYVPDLVHTCLDLLVDEASGLWHLSNGDAVTWADLARIAADRAALDIGAICPLPASELGFVASRPRYAALGSAHGRLMPSLADAIDRYVGEQSVLDLRAVGAGRG